MKTNETYVLQLEVGSECSRDTVRDQCPDIPRVDELFVHSESNISSISHMDYKVTSSKRSYISKFSDVNVEYDCKIDAEKYYPLQSTGSTNENPKLKKRSHFRIDCKLSSAMTRNEVCEYSPKSKDQALHSRMEELHLNRCEQLLTSTRAPEVSEQPNPIFVLNASLFYKDDSSLSPVKKFLIPLKEDETRLETGNLYHWNNFNYQSLDPIPYNSMAINNNLLESVHSLVRKLEDLTSTEYNMEQQIKSMAPQNEAPEYKYILEILSVAGLLQKYLDSIPMEFHASGFPINPELFRVLKKKRKTQKYDEWEKLHREVLFGTVNDILQRKLYPYLQLQQPWIIQ